MASPLSVHDRYNGFVVTKSIAIPEVHCHLTELTHEESGAEVLHIATDDPENFFSLSFRTLPENSNGVAHIVEHCVLCGSKKYPIKDPFFSMNRRSLNTFMNALTGADFTCYPAASQVEQDFYNLLEVYLDAVFCPLLKETSFSQEAYRLEFAVPDDSKTALQYKGIVYNEMKGSLSSPMTRLVEELNHALFPDSPYGHNSGGDPAQIPNLTYKEFLEFHKTYYHPSRCLFFFSGNLPLTKHLDFLETHALKGVKKEKPLPPIPLQPRFLKPVHKVSSYPIAPDETTTDKTMLAFAWLTCPILDQMTLLALHLLDIVLMETDASVLKLNLLKSGLCKQAQSMMDPEIAEIPYGIIVKGCSSENVEKIESILFSTLEKLAVEGIDPALIDSALHQLELFRSEITGDSAPHGLSLFSRSGLLKQHGGQAEDGLRIHSLFDEFKAKLQENPRYMSEVIQKYLCTNKHYVRLVMQPSHELAAHEAAKERDRLETIHKSLKDDDIKSIITRAKNLAAYQDDETNDNLDILPKIQIADVPVKAREIPLIKSSAGNLEVFHHQAFTNNITYANMVFSLPETKEEDLWLLRLFTILLPQLGSGLRGYQETLELIQEHTGGIGSFLTLNHQAVSSDSCSASFHIKGKAMYHKADKLFSLLYDMITQPDCTDRNRLKELILKHYTNLQSGIVSNALKYAMNLAASGVNMAGKINQAWYGLEYFYKVKELAEHIDDNLTHLISELERMRGVLTAMNPHLVITCDQTELSKYQERGFEGLQDIPQKFAAPWKANYQLQPLGSQGRIIASQVAFIAKTMPSIGYAHPHAAALSLASFLFDNLTLHKRVREQGGAYGSGSISSPMSGSFTFYSYRDPNIVSTLNAFDEALETVIKGEFDEEDLNEAKLEMMQNLDSPISPGSRADVAYSWWKEGKTADMRQNFRNSILKMSCHDIIEACEKELLPQNKNSTICAFASKDLLEKENSELQNRGFLPLFIEKIWV